MKSTAFTTILNDAFSSVEHQIQVFFSTVVLPDIERNVKRFIESELRKKSRAELLAIFRKNFTEVLAPTIARVFAELKTQIVSNFEAGMRYSLDIQKEDSGTFSWKKKNTQQKLTGGF